jgi:hypothetical protein
MATLATFFTRLFAPPMAAEAEVVRQTRAVADQYRLRSIPNEDIYFFVKHIDNTRVVREADPVAPRRCWKTIATGCMAVALLVGLLLPGAYSLLAGYQIQTLRAQQQELINERALLELEEAKLASPERLQHFAEMQKFVDPAPGHVIYLPSQEGSLALNVPKN